MSDPNFPDMPPEELDRLFKIYMDRRIESAVQENNAKHHKKTSVAVQKEKPSNGHKKFSFSRNKIDYSKYEPESEETINLHTSGILPRSDKLQFIDPQAVALPNKAIPREKHIIEQMSKPVKRAPIPFIMIGLMLIVAMIALSILYDRVIEPAQDAERAYNLEVLKNGGNSTGIAKPSGGGGLFQFNPVNPFAPRPTG